MADYFTTPKTNWVSTDGIGYEDLNRNEANISAIRDATYRKPQGFGYLTDNSVVGEDGVLTFFHGSCYSENKIPINSPVNFLKNLKTWAEGNGAAFGGMASAVTVAANTWYYAFVISDPTDGSVDLMFDDNPSGTNITSGVFTEKRYINSFRTGAAGGDGSFDLVEMYSTGDQVFINPVSLNASRGKDYANSAPNDGKYNTIALTSNVGGTEYALPARAVLAQLNVEIKEIDEIGFYSLLYSVFTVPTDMLSGSVRQAEFLHRRNPPTPSPLVITTFDFDIMVNAARQISLAMIGDSVGDGNAYIGVRGFTDERLI